MKTWITFSLCASFFLFALGLVSCEDEEGKIRASPVAAGFSVESPEVMTGNSVSFSDVSTGDVSHWSWFFEGGTPGKSNLQDPVVVYEAAGTFEVKLVVSNSKYTDQLIRSGYIVVSESPKPLTAEFSADRISALSGESIAFTSAVTGNPDTWSWAFIHESGTILTSTNSDPVMTFELPGRYSVKLVVANSAYTDEALKEDYITIVDASNVVAGFGTATRVTYAGQAVSFEDLSVGNVTAWQWTFEGGTPASSSEQHPVVTYANAGTYKVTLEVSNQSNMSVKEEAGYMMVIPGDGLVTFLSFDGNGDDRGPLHLDVTNSGSVTFSGTSRKGQPDATAVFNGTGSLLIAPAAEKQLGTSGYSVGVWLKSEVPERMMIWEEGGGGAGLPQAWFRINDNASENRYRFNPNTGGFVNVGETDGPPHCPTTCGIT